MSKKAIDLSGMLFGSLTVIKRSGNYGKEPKWECKCICGNFCFVSSSHLKRGQKVCRPCSFKNRSTHKMSNTYEYKAWARMIQRATNTNLLVSKYYISKGISVCDNWLLFENFFKDMGYAPTKKHTLDRFPNNMGNYEPGNVRWATMKEQSRNKSSNKIIEFNGVKKCIADWCEEYGLEKRTLCSRLLSGWDIEKAITSPVLVSRKINK